MEPDSFIEGSVLDFRHEVHTYDMAGNVSEFRVTILFSIKMTDLRLQRVMYENNRLMLSQTYMPNSPNPDVNTTQEEAIEEIFDRAFQTVLRATLAAW
jgi:hypothetical protein